MRRLSPILAALLALSLSACEPAKPSSVSPQIAPAKPVTPSKPGDGRLGAWKVYDTNGVVTTIKTTDQGSNVGELNVIVDSMPTTPISGTITAITSITNPVNTKPATVAATAYWTSQSSAATLTGSALDTTGYRSVCFDFTLVNTSTPVGTLEIDQSVDGTNNWGAIYIDANKLTWWIGTVSHANIQAFAGSDQLMSLSSPSGTVTAKFCVESMQPFVRLVYTRASGGAVSTINASYTLRSN